MELVESYLKTVKSYLPRRHREDITTELADEIHSQIEEKESELRRPLNEAEIQSLLFKFGDPVVVAARYRQRRPSVTFGRELIGPDSFPTTCGYFSSMLSSRSAGECTQLSTTP